MKRVRNLDAAGEGNGLLCHDKIELFLSFVRDTCFWDL